MNENEKVFIMFGYFIINVRCFYSVKLLHRMIANQKCWTVEEIKQSGKIVIGVFSDKKPFGTLI